MSFQEMRTEEVMLNPFIKIGKEWMLITAGGETGFNMMTASWGGLGVFWGRNTATVYIRPQRYTKEFVDANETFTISFLPSDYKKALNLCGSVSGREHDKVKETGLTPLFVDGTVSFEEASMILICRKLYQDSMPPENFIDMGMDAKWYPDHDYHTLYIAEILKVLKRG